MPNLRSEKRQIDNESPGHKHGINASRAFFFSSDEKLLCARAREGVMRNSDGSQPLRCRSVVLRPVGKRQVSQGLDEPDGALLVPTSILGRAFSVEEKACGK